VDSILQKRKRCNRIDALGIGGYMPGDIEVVAAFDIDKRKVIKSMFDKRIFPDS